MTDQNVSWEKIIGHGKKEIQSGLLAAIILRLVWLVLSMNFGALLRSLNGIDNCSSTPGPSERFG